MNRWSVGRAAAAGALATLPMTAVMAVGLRFLPRSEQYALPPREVTDEVRRRTKIAYPVSERLARLAALAAHFGYGAAAGSLFAAFPGRRETPIAQRGAVYGFAVWAGSYLGLLPALNLLSPATAHPRGRTALMITSHLVWGAATGFIYQATAVAPVQNSSHIRQERNDERAIEPSASSFPAAEPIHARLRGSDATEARSR